MSKGPAVVLPGDYIALGWVVRPHGLKGEVKISLGCSGLERITHCQALELFVPQRPPKVVTVVKAFQHSDGDVVVRLKEVEGRDAAEALRGAALAVKATEAAALPEGQYRRHEVLGLAVETPDGRPLGTLEDLQEMPANWVLVIRGVDGKERLLPAHPSVVKRVDLKTRRMVVEPLDEVEV